MSSRWIVLAVASCLAVQPCGAQGIRDRSRHRRPTPPRPCRVLCTPQVALMPAVITTHLLGGPQVRSLATGLESRLPSTSDFELIASVALPTSSRTCTPSRSRRRTPGCTA